MKLKKSELGEFVPVLVDNGMYYGGYQNMLGMRGVSKFYRDRACVVTAFTNTFLYMYEDRDSYKADCYNNYHYDFYRKIRPHINGVSTAKSLDRRVNRIRKAKNLILESHILEENAFNKKPIEEKLAFINEGLSKNCPVVFINWMSKDVRVMRHHGVTITECNDMGTYHELVISSWGHIYKINFEVFDKQIRSYSGLIYFERKDYGIYKG